MTRGRLLRELTDALPVERRPHAVHALAVAIHDLRGSISKEALPEMAYRLALFRLTNQPAHLDSVGRLRGFVA